MVTSPAPARARARGCVVGVGGCRVCLFGFVFAARLMYPSCRMGLWLLRESARADDVCVRAASSFCAMVDALSAGHSKSPRARKSQPWGKATLVPSPAAERCRRRPSPSLAAAPFKAALQLVVVKALSNRCTFFETQSVRVNKTDGVCKRKKEARASVVHTRKRKNTHKNPPSEALSLAAAA